MKRCHLFSYARLEAGLRQARGQAGFTLVEVLLAVAIMAVMLSMIYTTFDQTTRLNEHLEAAADPYRIGRVVLSRMSDQITSAYVVKGDPDTFFKGEDGQTPDGNDGDSLEFSSLSRVTSGGGKVSFQNELRYSMEGQDLFYSERLNPLGSGTYNTVTFPLIEGLSGFKLRYLDRSTDEWVDSWGTNNKELLPSAVEVSLMFPVSKSLSDDESIRPEQGLVLTSVIRVPLGGA